jgi:2-methylisocitrate lyase-like PEP mutase family enzyme
MNQVEKAALFAKLHVKGSPLILYNAWDAGSAKTIADAGARAIATSSWAVAEAEGYRDGETIPLDFVDRIVSRIADTVDVPLSVDFEGGYSEDDSELAQNIVRLLDLGVVGINFEDRVVKGPGLYTIDRQAQRISAIRAAASNRGVPLFINARTDLFLGQGAPDESIETALERAKLYAAAGASGFFVPGLQDEKFIARLCEGTTLPVNIMVMAGVPTIKRLTELGVARVSYGPIPYNRAMDALRNEAKKVFL